MIAWCFGISHGWHFSVLCVSFALFLETLHADMRKDNDLNIFNDVSKSRKGHAVHTV